MENDPSGKKANESGAKLDYGKPDLSLLLMFGHALVAVGEVGTAGAAKYSRGGWQDVPDGINRYTAALLRHMLKEHYEEFDSDISSFAGKNIRHAAQVCWNSLARLELILRNVENDNTRKS